jgi:uncharacterized protein (DUF427 family)
MLWKYYGQKRPPFADSTGPDQESVWDYPRPPRIVSEPRPVRIRYEGIELVATNRAIRILETASAPGVYVPPEDIVNDRLSDNEARTWCEWKGEAHYYDLLARQGIVRGVAWSYPAPSPDFAKIAGYLSFYPGRVECYIGEERVRPQPGGFYGGWVTAQVAGPIKGAPGTELW